MWMENVATNIPYTKGKTTTYNQPTNQPTDRPTNIHPHITMFRSESQQLVGGFESDQICFGQRFNTQFRALLLFSSRNWLAIGLKPGWKEPNDKHFGFGKDLWANKIPNTIRMCVSQCGRVIRGREWERDNESSCFPFRLWNYLSL